MGKELDKYDAIVLCIFFLIALQIWAIPSLTSPYLFGEGDSYWHYGLADYIVESNHIDKTMPYSYINKAFLWNPVLGPLAREYPPVNHVNYANIIFLGGDKFVPLGIFKAISSFIVFLGVYLLCKYLFSQTIAIIASFGVLFSNRSFSTFLFGQQPTTISFVFVPLVLYSFYKTIENISKGEDFKKYLFMMFAFILAQFLLHVQGVFISALLIISISILFVIKFLINKRAYLLKKIFSKNKMLFYICTILVILVVVLPFFSIYFGRLAEETGQVQKDFSRIFKWNIDSKLVAGSYPPDFVSATKEYSIFFIPFIFLGIIFSILKLKSDRSESYLFILGSLIGSYLIFHSDLLVGNFLSRIARMQIFESYILWIFIALGISFVISFLVSSSKSFLGKEKSNYVKYTLIAVVLILIYIQIGVPIKTSAENAYTPTLRVNAQETEASNWIKQNIPMESAFFVKTTQVYAISSKYRFIRAIAHRATYPSSNISFDIKDFNKQYSDANKKYGTNLPLITNSYLLLDYSDYRNLAMQDKSYEQIVASIENYEKRYFSDKKPLYNKDNIVIYNITGMEIY